MQFFTQKIPFHAGQYEQPERDIIFKITIFENHKKGQKNCFPELDLNPGPNAC